MRSRVQSVVAVSLAVSSAAWGQADLVGWGSNGEGEASRPSGIAGWLTAVDCGENFTVALRSSGGVVGWGLNNYGQLNVPASAGHVTLIDAGYFHVAGLTADGRVVAWGYNDYGECNVPGELGTCIDVGAGRHHTLAVTSSGLVRVWGSNSHGERDVPLGMGPAVDVVAGNHWSLARLANGTVRAWGYNGHGETVIPSFPQAPSKVVAGSHHALALIPGGTVVAWGRNGSGECNVPADLGQVADIAAGYHHSLALLADGSIRAWGWNENGQTNVPPGISARLIAGGVRHSVALTTCVSAGGPADCDNDGITDLCELAAGAPDANGNGRPDNCDPPWSPAGETAGAREWTGPAGSGYGRHWFFLSTERVDFATAKQRARDLGGRLAVITSAEEWSFVNGLLGENPNFAYWVGLERVARCAPWQTATGEPFGLWNPTWAYDNCDDFAVSVSGVGGWRSSRPTELRRYIVEFDFADLDNDGVADSQQPSMTSDCNGNGLRDSAELRFSPQLDCNGNGTIDSCDVRRVPFYVDQEWVLPTAGSPVESSISAGVGTSTDITVRISAIGDLGETFKGEYVDVEVEGLGTVRVGGQDCQWVSVDRGIPAATAVAALADGAISVRLSAGADVDASSCATGLVRVQLWWSLPTAVADLNGNGRPDTCDTSWTPDLSQYPGIIQRGPGHWYWVSNDGRNFDGARARARELGGQLLTVTSDDELSFVRTQLLINPEEEFWVGMSRQCGESTREAFAWLTGENRRFDPTWYWLAYVVPEPCNFTAAVLAPALGLRSESAWEGRRYIVEFDFRDCNSNGQLDMFEMPDPSKDKDLDGRLDECGPMTGPDCDGDGTPDRWAIETGAAPDANGNWRPDSCDFAWQPSGDTAAAIRWERGLGHRHWYLFVQSAVQYGAAKEIARRMGGHLATVTTREEAAFLEARMRVAHGGESEWWVGMERDYGQSSMASLRWVTGEPRRHEPFWFVEGSWNYDSVAIHSHRGWRTAPRNERRWYIVEFDFRDADEDGQFDWREMMVDPSLDCDGDGLLDAVQVAAGISDCNQNGIPDRCDIAAGVPDSNGNGRPDACDGSWTPSVSYPSARPLVRNGIGGRWYWISPETASYDVAKRRASDMGGRLVTVTTSMEASFLRNELLNPFGNEEFWVGMERLPGQCETSQFVWITGEARRYAESWHYNACWNFDAAAIRSNGDYRAAPRWESRRYIVEFDLADCNQNGIRDWQEMLDVSKDAEGNGLLDACELAGGYNDCNQNGIPDAIDIAAGMPDANGNGRPDSCDLAWQPTGGAAGAVRWTYGGGGQPGGGQPGGGGHWYLASNERMDYFTAKEAAHAMGGRLATVTSQAEWDFLSSVIGGDPNRSYWIGIERPCNCCDWQAISGEPFGSWSAPWSVNDCNVAASVSIAGNWRSSSPFELRNYLVEFDFVDLDGDGIPDAGQPDMQVDCNNDGLRDRVETLVFPSIDCDSNGRIDSCDTARTPFYAEVYADLPAGGGTSTVTLPVNPGTSSEVRVRAEAIGDLGEPFKGETVDVSIEGLATLRMPAGQCGWVGDERTFTVTESTPVIADGMLTFTVAVGSGVDAPACGESRVRVRAWYQLPTAVSDVNGDGIPDACEAVPGDLNGDRAVNGLDLGIFLSQWGTPAPHSADLNSDGEVNGLDLGILLQSWGFEAD